MVIKYFLFVVAAWIGWASSMTMSTDYCNFTPNHTLCKFSERGPRCGPHVRGIGVRPVDAMVIVALHNKLRSKVARGEENEGEPGPQPHAANMRLMVWDEELAKVAQGHANQCVFQHDCQDCRRVDRFKVGQNLFISFQSLLDLRIEWNRAILGWYNEVKFFPNTSVQPYQFSEQTGHYTQMLWWDTAFIGCGFIMFLEDSWWKKLYTCNYGPAGNILLSQMYLQGAPCSACPVGTSCSLNYPGLCEEDDARDLTSNTPTTILPPTPNRGDTNTILTNFNGFSGLINLNSIAPNNPDLEALVEFFNNFRRNTLITAQPTTTIDASTATPTTPAPPSAKALDNIVDDGVDSDATNTELNALNTTPTSEESASSVSLTPESLSSIISSTITSSDSLSPLQNETDIQTLKSALALSIAERMASLSSPTPPPMEPEAEQITPVPEMMKDSENETHMESNRGNEEKLTLMSILMRAGRNTQVIRTSSLDDVHRIIEDLEKNVTPIVVFRSRTGELTELDPTSLTPLPRRSQRSVSNQASSPSRLLTCEMDMSLCTISVVGGNWTVAKRPSEGNHLMIHVREGEGTQVIVKNLIQSPPSGVACVDFTYRRDMMPADFTTNAAPADDDDASDPTSNTLPDLQVGVMLLGRQTSHKTVLGAAGRWERNRSTFRDLNTKFIVMVSMSPASTPSTLALDTLIVTDGPC